MNIMVYQSVRGRGPHFTVVRGGVRCCYYRASAEPNRIIRIRHGIPEPPWREAVPPLFDSGLNTLPLKVLPEMFPSSILP
jgi:hypothetical protein